MADGVKGLRDLIGEVLDERAEAVSVPPAEIEAGVTQLRQMFRESRERAAAERRLASSRTAASVAVESAPASVTKRLRYEAVLHPGVFWLRLGDLTCRLIVGETRRTS